MKETFTASEICEAADCVPSTLRAWKRRNGLFPHIGEANGWSRYDFADALGVKLMVVLAARGFTAQGAADWVNAMRPTLENAATGGAAPRIGVGRRYGGDTLQFCQIDEKSPAGEVFSLFDDSIVTVINLNTIRFEVLDVISKMRGLGLAKAHRIIFGDGNEGETI